MRRRCCHSLWNAFDAAVELLHENSTEKLCIFRLFCSHLRSSKILKYVLDKEKGILDFFLFFANPPPARSILDVLMIEML